MTSSLLTSDNYPADEMIQTENNSRDKQHQTLDSKECNVEDNGKDTLAEDEGESKDSHNYWYLRMNNYTCLLSYILQRY